MEIKKLAEKYEPYIIERRRYYHTCPELSNHEKETRAQIKKDLEAIGIKDIREMKDCYGLIADIHGGKPGRTVALRTDIDALEIAEKTGLPFASSNGSMHACGHDNHIAMLLGAAKILNEVREELCGTVRLVVQPAEEVATGARAMVQEGAMDGVDAIYGAHIWGTLNAPLIDVTPGSRMACCDKFSIEVEGATAHGSAPHLGVDAITVSAAIINNLQQCVSRMNDPLNPLVLTVGTIHGGSRWNSVPGSVSMEGTVRTFEKELNTAKIMKKVVEDTAAAFNAKAALDYMRLTPPVLNENDQLNRIAHDAVIKLYGEEGVGQLPTMMASEDFSWFGEKVPYIFAFVGSRNEAKGLTYTNHNEHYDVDESVLKRGAAVMAQFSVDFLQEK
ncbi:MAG: amidohydrolase [Fretibacterium sp.]|nr:amidohydrolase [Fretibacterium sp.]